MGVRSVAQGSGVVRTGGDGFTRPGTGVPRFASSALGPWGERARVVGGTVSLVEGRRLSLPRLGVVLVVAAGLAFGSLQGWRWFEDARADVPQGSWFAPYVDVTATPTEAFEDVRGREPNVVLAFVVADPEQACRPTWGAAYTLDEAADQLDLDRRIARVEQLGGSAVVSFGGQANTELAVSCTDPERLRAAYEEVVERYGTDVIDLDVEGPALADTAATQRRAEALAALQADRDLEVWLTLPVDPQGLTDEGQAVVRATLAAGVDLAGVNAMTMNYGASKDEGQSMGAASVDALESLHDQVVRLWADAGQELTPSQAWRRIGATPMAGQNDVAGEVFGVDDAQRLHAFADQHRLGRVSLWSLNRDRACGANYPDVTIVSDSCSGVVQDEGAFSAVLGASFDDAPDPAGDSASPTPAADPTATPVDDPATSPYPVWQQDGVYQRGERVVWRRNVYVAKWWTSGEEPDDPTIEESAAAWRLIGPVLPGETPEPTPTVAAGTYPAWQPDRPYLKDERVLWGGYAYVALWWTEGDAPDAQSTQSEPSPWRLLRPSEVDAGATPPAGG